MLCSVLSRKMVVSMTAVVELDPHASILIFCIPRMAMCLFDQHFHPITSVFGERIEVIPVELNCRSFSVEQLQVELPEDGSYRHI